jgi:hypothetical protein
VKVFAVPVIASALTAALSVVFFVELARTYGDSTLARIIMIQATAALVQIITIPSSWVYLLGAIGRREVVERYSEGQAVEWAGIAVGTVFVLAGGAIAGGRAAGLLVAFLSLAVAASSSCLGYLRATADWRRYVTWVLMPNLIRLPLIWATPLLMRKGILPDLSHDVAAIVACFFLVPELCRLAAIYMPLAAKTFEWQGVRRTLAGARHILHNWLFDLGSALTDQADKLLVGALLGPQILVTYFFGRRLGSLAVMVTEPMYVELYRRMLTGAAPVTAWRTWLKGLGAAVALWAMMASMVGFLILTPAAVRYLPDAVVAFVGVLLAVMLLDSLSAANRWSRYLAQAANRSAMLLAFRLLVFAVFAASLAALARRIPVWGVVLAMLASLACETAYLGRLHGSEARR